MISGRWYPRQLCQGSLHHPAEAGQLSLSRPQLGHIRAGDIRAGHFQRYSKNPFFRKVGCGQNSNTINRSGLRRQRQQRDPPGPPRLEPIRGALGVRHRREVRIPRGYPFLRLREVVYFNFFLKKTIRTASRLRERSRCSWWSF